MGLLNGNFLYEIIIISMLYSKGFNYSESLPLIPQPLRMSPGQYVRMAALYLGTHVSRSSSSSCHRTRKEPRLHVESTKVALDYM